MGKINVLDKSIFNRIAAGEVVEKPASVVKELVENSIDGGATIINIDILNGGKTRIRVTDNGCGIEKDDLTQAFLPHATSKVSTVDDLDSIGTLGFRGEALSSIASVSKVTMMSKIKDSDEGNKITIEGGEVKSVEPVGCTDGTTVLVEDLFYNVPARAKFLRKERQEESDITNYISRLIMSNPNLTIKYSADNKQIYSSYGTGLYDSIYTVYGKSIIDNIIEFKFNNDTYNITGYLGKPTFSKPNRTYQTLVINGRYVINQAVSAAIYKAYENYIMKGTFPFFVLHLQLPLDKVDVNVHPNKLDVKFDDYNKVFGLVFTSVAEKLHDVNSVKNISLLDDFTEENCSNINLQTISENEGISYKQSEQITENNIKEVSLENDLFDKNLNSIKSFLTNSNTDFKVQNNDLAYKLAEQLTQSQVDVLPKVADQTKFVLDVDEYKILGVAFNTYIVIEKNNELYFIDQHAAHERLLYDKFKENFTNKNLVVQPLLVPYILELNHLEKEFISQNISAFNAIGFDIEDFGALSYKVNSVPLLLKNMSINAFFTEVLANINNKIILKQSDIIEDYLAKSACKTAVKANDILSDLEIKILLTKLSNEKQVLLCPHGRPIILRITQNEIEKWFKRIV